jgi:hypothetical protein
MSLLQQATNTIPPTPTGPTPPITTHTNNEAITRDTYPPSALLLKNGKAQETGRHDRTSYENEAVPNGLSQRKLDNADIVYSNHIVLDEPVKNGDLTPILKLESDYAKYGRFTNTPDMNYVYVDTQPGVQNGCAMNHIGSDDIGVFEKVKKHSIGMSDMEISASDMEISNGESSDLE